jgi:hypothetical protein
MATESRIEELLERIAIAVEVIAESLLPQEEQNTAGCLHPEDMRVNLSRMGDPGRFYCRECGFRNDEGR